MRAFFDGEGFGFCEGATERREGAGRLVLFGCVCPDCARVDGNDEDGNAGFVYSALEFLCEEDVEETGEAWKG